MTYLEEEKTCSASASACGSTQKVCPKTGKPIKEEAAEETCKTACSNSEKTCS